MRSLHHRLRVAGFSVAMALVVALSLTALVLPSAREQDSPQRYSRQGSRTAILMRLPSDFVGCWRGTIQGDDFKPAIPGNTMSKDPTTYELCYGPVSEGTYRLNLLKLMIGMAVVRPDRFDSQVISADDQAGTAKIRNHLILTQTRYILWTVPVRFHVEVDAVEDCRLVSHDVILMRGTQLIAVNEKMYGKQTFHADFRRVSSHGTP